MLVMRVLLLCYRGSKRDGWTALIARVVAILGMGEPVYLTKDPK